MRGLLIGFSEREAGSIYGGSELESGVLGAVIKDRTWVL
jgi:hypothetical protein